MTALDLKKHSYKEALRYYENAREILKIKAKKEGTHYQDAKYVRMACGTAYNGVLLALDTYLRVKSKEIVKKKSQRKSVDDYRSVLVTLDKKLLITYNDAYEYLHLVGYYDGNTHYEAIKIGMESASAIINKIKPASLNLIKK